MGKICGSFPLHLWTANKLFLSGYNANGVALRSQSALCFISRQHVLWFG
jgi:hypothetical protein